MYSKFFEHLRRIKAANKSVALFLDYKGSYNYHFPSQRLEYSFCIFETEDNHNILSVSAESIETCISLVYQNLQKRLEQYGFKYVD